MAPGLNPTHAVAELRDAQDAQRLGTAFLVGSSLALTAFHCVRDHNRVLLRFLEHSAFASVVLRGDSEDDANDIALLHLDTDAPPEVARLPLSIDPEDDDEVTAIGFPLALAAPRFVVGGKVRSAHAQHPSRRHATHDDRYVQWFCEEALSGVALRGLSGGPLLSGPPGQRVAVGIVIFNEADRQGVARGGAVWAASAKTAVDLWSEELGQLLAKSIRYEYSETRLSGRAICSAVWSHSGDHYVVATQDALELYDACGVFDRKFPAPKACYLQGRNVQWDPGDARVAILADSGEFEVLDITSDRYIKVGSDIGLVNGWDQYSWSSDGRTIAIAANLFKTVGISGGVFFVPETADLSELKLLCIRGVLSCPSASGVSLGGRGYRRAVD